MLCTHGYFNQFQNVSLFSIFSLGKAVTVIPKSWVVTKGERCLFRASNLFQRPTFGIFAGISATFYIQLKKLLYFIVVTFLFRRKVNLL